jgi:hypothetical protein
MKISSRGVRNQVVSSLVWLWWVIDLVRFKFKFETVLFVLLLSLFHLKNRVCLSRGVQVTGAVWRAATRIVAGVWDLVQRNMDGRTGRVLGGMTIERSGGVLYGLHRACGDEEHGFLGWASKPRSTVCQWVDLKTTRTVFCGLASKPVATVFSGLASKPVATISSGLASKSIVMVSVGLASKPAMTISSDFTSKPAATVSTGLSSKLVATVSPGLTSKHAVTVSPGLTLKSVEDFLVEPQNQCGWGFFGLGFKIDSYSLVI